MQIKYSHLADLVEDVLIDEYGIYYFFDGFVVSEINEGVTYTWEASQALINAAYEHYGPNPNVCYISNRINQYSIKPTDWLKFFKNNNQLNGYATVSYNEKNWLNALIEKAFMFTKVERFKSLEDAIAWARQLNKDQENQVEKPKKSFIF